MASQRHVAVIENIVVEAERPIVPTCYVFEWVLCPPDGRQVARTGR
jgi:hypothetical protein